MVQAISISDSHSSPGSVNRANEDALGGNRDCAFVIDGATGLGDVQLIDGHPSDAAWLASFVRECLEENFHRHSPIRPFVRDMIVQSREAFLSTVVADDIAKYAWPAASFAMLFLAQESLWFAGLGDCTLYVQSDKGVQIINPLDKFEGREANHAAAHLQRTGGFSAQKNLLSDPHTLENLRHIRSLQNTAESGVWTLGLVPEAAEHMVIQKVEVEANSHALLCSDGFSALHSDYRSYTAEALLEAARDNGLKPLMDELRHIETSIDPEGLKYPRYKQSDDATALLVELSI